VTHPLMMKRACESAASGRVGRSVDDVRLPGPTRVLDVSRTHGTLRKYTTGRPPSFTRPTKLHASCQCKRDTTYLFS
jgi:hypothetical protein